MSTMSLQTIELTLPLLGPRRPERVILRDRYIAGDIDLDEFEATLGELIAEGMFDAVRVT